MYGMKWDVPLNLTNGESSSNTIFDAWIEKAAITAKTS